MNAPPNPLIAQLLGETPHPIPKNPRRPILRGLCCDACGRDDLTDADFKRNPQGVLSEVCNDCHGERIRAGRKQGVVTRRLKRLARHVERIAVRFSVWAIEQHFDDQTRIMRMVRDLPTYVAMQRSWSATARELLTARDRLRDLEAT